MSFKNFIQLENNLLTFSFPRTHVVFPNRGSFKYFFMFKAYYYFWIAL